MKKIRGRTLIVFGFAALSGAALLHVSQRVQQAEDELSVLQRSYNMEQETIRVLNAEWAYLNSPARLEALANEYLDVKAPSPEQMVPRPEGLPVLDVVPPAEPQTLYHEISTSAQEEAAEDVETQVRIPAPGRKPKSIKGDFRSLMKKMGKGGAQ